MAENDLDQQQLSFHEKLSKILIVLVFVVLLIVDLVWLVVAFLLAPVVILLIPVLIILRPVLIILSPVLIILVFIILSPWLITLVLVILWLYKYVTGKHPIGAEHVDKACEKIAEAAKEVKNKVEQLANLNKVEQLANYSLGSTRSGSTRNASQ